MVEPTPNSRSAPAENGLWVWVPEPAATSWLLPELLAELRRSRVQILSAFIGGSILALALSFLMPTRYHSTAVVALIGTQQSSALTGLAGQIGGFAGLTGLSLPSLSASQNVVALATLQSRTYLVDFGRQHGVVENLFASRFDSSTGQWRSGVFHGSSPPTDDEIFEAMQDVLNVKQETVTGLVTIVVKASTPQLAQEWARSLVAGVNEQLRLREVEDAERAIAYLHQQIALTSVAELRQVFYRLIEDRTRTAMLANISPEYALKIVDAPSLADRAAEPRRALMAILAAVCCALLVLIWVFIRFAMRPFALPNAPTQGV